MRHVSLFRDGFRFSLETSLPILVLSLVVIPSALARTLVVGSGGSQALSTLFRATDGRAKLLAPVAFTAQDEWLATADAREC